MAVSKRKRFEIFKRDSFTCQYCGRTPPTVILECDHVVPVAEDGSDDETNLVTACFDCNRGKSDVPLESVIKTAEERAKLMREKREQVEAYNAMLMEEREAVDAAVDRIGNYWFNKYKSDKDCWQFGDARVPTIRRFLASLTETEILDAVDIAFSRIFVMRDDNDYKAFKYFCGICWNRIREAQ
jgi:hypothetical protein